MTEEPVLDEQTVATILDGSYAAEHLELARVVDTLRSVASTSAPAPSDALAAVFARRLSPDGAPDVAPERSHTPWRRPVVRARSLVAGLSIVGKLTLGASVAAAATTGVGAAGALPVPMQRQFARVVNPVAPFDVYQPGPVADLPPTAARVAVEVAQATPPVPPTTDAPPPSSSTTVAPVEAPPAPSTAAVSPTPPPAPTVTDAPAPKEKPKSTEDPTPPSTAVTKPSTTQPPKTTTTKPPSTSTTLAVAYALGCTQAETAATVTCTWTATAPVAATRLVLMRSGPDGTKTVLDTRDLAVAQHLDTTTAIGKTYTYTLYAKNDAGTKVARSASVKVVVVAR